MPSVDQWAESARRRPAVTLARAALASTVVVLLCVGLVGLVTTGSVFFAGAVAKHTIGPRVEQQVYTPENAIAQIAFFHNTCQDVNRGLRTVANNQARLAADQTAARYSQDPITRQQAIQSLVQDQQDVTGALNLLASTVADYNSRSAQSTANVFKGRNLPRRISLPTSPPVGYSISCG